MAGLAKASAIGAPETTVPKLLVFPVHPSMVSLTVTVKLPGLGYLTNNKKAVFVTV